MEEKFDLLQYVENGMNEMLAESEWKDYSVRLHAELEDGPDYAYPVPVLVYEMTCRDLVYVYREELYHLRNTSSNYCQEKINESFSGILKVVKYAENHFKNELMRKFLEAK